MSTTTLRLSSELKTRIIDSAKKLGVSPHHFMLEAVAEKTAQTELQAEFYAVADSRYAKLLETGETLAWDSVRDYLRTKAVK